VEATYAERYGVPAADEAWRKAAERFAREEVLPLARDADRAGRMPEHLPRRLGELGFLGVSLPKAQGGGGGSALAYALVSEELGRADGSVRGFVAVHGGLVTATVARLASEEVRARWLPGLLSGRTIGCFALTEPEAGSDAAAIRTRVREEGDAVVLDGEKHWITNGTLAQVALVFASADPAAGAKGIEGYVVPTDAPGFEAKPMEGRPLGHRASDHARIVLRGVRVPKANRLGEARGGFRAAMAGLDLGRLSVAAGAVGIHAACLDLAVAHARSRRQFGQRIGDFQQVGAALAECHVSLEASRLLVHHAARTLDRGGAATAETSAAKLRATEAAVEAATLAVRVHGARGYDDLVPAERHLRDAVALTVYEGTSEIQRVILARGLLGKDDRAAGTAFPAEPPAREDR
jgi:alkylation response protein AidB-like acyl-CoA dehydrogenase